MFEKRYINDAIGNGLFARTDIKKKCNLTYVPPICQILGGNHDKGILVVGTMCDTLFELVLPRYREYVMEVKLRGEPEPHHFFANTTTSRGEYVSRNHCPSNWRDIYKAETIFPLLTKAWDRYGPTINWWNNFPNHTLLTKNIFREFPMHYVPFQPHGEINEQHATSVNHRGKLGKENAAIRYNDRDGSVYIQVNKGVKANDQILINYSKTFFDEDVNHEQVCWSLLKDLQINEGNRERWKLGIAIIWWLHQSTLPFLKPKLEQALDYLLEKDFVSDAFTRPFLTKLATIYPSKQEVITALLKRSTPRLRKQHKQAPMLRQEIVNLKRGDIVCVYEPSYWGNNNSSKPSWCTYMICSVWGGSKKRHITATCIDSKFPEWFGKENILLHGSHNNQHRSLGKLIKVNNTDPEGTSGGGNANFYYRWDIYELAENETPFPTRVEDAQIKKIHARIRGLKEKERLPSVEELVEWNHLKWRMESDQKHRDDMKSKLKQLFPHIPITILETLEATMYHDAYSLDHYLSTSDVTIPQSLQGKEAKNIFETRESIVFGSNAFHVESNGKKYWGEYLHRKRHGFGKLLLPNGTYYIGMFKNNRYEGKGTMHHPNGDEYAGVFSNNELSKGRVRYASGNVYSGELSGWKRHGTGRFTEASTKHAYDGQWYYNMLHGYATHFDASENILFQGIYSFGNPSDNTQRLKQEIKKNARLKKEIDRLKLETRRDNAEHHKEIAKLKEEIAQLKANKRPCPVSNPRPPKKPKKGRVILTIMDHDTKQLIVPVKTSWDKSLHKLFTFMANREKIQESACNFVWHQCLMKPTDTPKSLGIREGQEESVFFFKGISL